MEGLAPPMRCLIEIQTAIANGESVRSGVLRYVQLASPTDEFAESTRAFLFSWDQGRDWRAVIKKIKSAHRRSLLDVIAIGLGGHSIASHLESLRSEIAEACHLEIQNHLEMLPLKMLMPLLLFQFPAFLLLLFGPLLRHLIEEMNR